MSGGRSGRTRTPDSGPTPAPLSIAGAGRGVLPLLLVVVLSALGCALPGGRAAPESGPTRASAPATIRVDNRSGFSLTVRVVTQDGNRRRLGTVGSFETAAFELPASVLSAYTRFQLTADPTGSRVRYGSDPVIIRPGNLVTWAILTDDGRSTISVDSGSG